jgi:four helix bundle protein
MKWRRSSGFEDIKAWQKARALVKAIYDVTSRKAKLSKDYGVKEQIRRAAVSVMSDIAEGFARRRD